MSARHTHWGVEYLTNSSGRREGWHLDLHSIQSRRFDAMQAALDWFCSGGNSNERWTKWHELRNAGRIRAVKLTIRKDTTS